ncbi:MFS general substrate transporter [Fistulina hepatica ATCC 64428]|uniref:MFS general substrate transporter n=1 Tax=Fistulina hepatica ATCC 64428 TaxID=1128425 RepID=A0A0D7A2F5_9AGAR|nr:MFS general substrate transporter [Fistulina hepatica ATCC 64428]
MPDLESGDQCNSLARIQSLGREESALPSDKKLEALEKVEDDWQDDPINPRNWSPARKWVAVSIVAFYTFVSPLSSSTMAPGLPEIAIKYNIQNETLLALTLSVYLLGYAIGPLFIAPLSEMYGRTWLLHVGNIVSAVLNIGCAYAPTTGALIVLRFFTGLGGSVPIAIGGGSIGDLFAAHERAAAMALYSVGPLIGPVAGPIAGGFLSVHGVKWLFILVGCVCALASVVGIPFLHETYAPIIRIRRAKREGHLDVLAKTHPHFMQIHNNKRAILFTNLIRPLMMLFGSIICFVLSLYMAFTYGIYYLMFTTFSDVFVGIYGFDTSISGLAYLGLGTGFGISTLFGARAANTIYLYFCKKNGGVGKPEYRIPALIFASIFVPIGLFWYGWSTQARAHWIMPIIGSGIFGFGIMTGFLPVQLYLVDTFPYAASALSAASFFRSLLGFAFPLFGSQMYDALGQGGGNSLLGGLAIALGIPFPVYLWFYGEKLRMNGRLTREMTLNN